MVGGGGGGGRAGEGGAPRRAGLGEKGRRRTRGGEKGRRRCRRPGGSWVSCAGLIRRIRPGSGCGGQHGGASRPRASRGSTDTAHGAAGGRYVRTHAEPAPGPGLCVFVLRAARRPRIQPSARSPARIFRATVRIRPLGVMRACHTPAPRRPAAQPQSRSARGCLVCTPPKLIRNYSAVDRRSERR